MGRGPCERGNELHRDNRKPSAGVPGGARVLPFDGRTQSWGMLLVDGGTASVNGPGAWAVYQEFMAASGYAVSAAAVG